MARMSTKKALAARKSWQERAETWRDKIAISQIVNRLNKCAEGTEEMTPTQLKAATVLLSKVLPDLSASDHTTRTETADPQALLDRLKEIMPEEVYAQLAGEYTPQGGTDATKH
jgi:hypothetical protein